MRQRKQTPSSQSGTADSKIESKEARTSHYNRLDLEIGGRRAALEKRDAYSPVKIPRPV
jgi:hypothetical protein